MTFRFPDNTPISNGVNYDGEVSKSISIFYDFNNN